MQQPAAEITQLLKAWSGGDENALDRLAPLVYGELHRRAHHYIATEKSGHTLQTTALLNEAYLRLVDAQKLLPRTIYAFCAAGKVSQICQKRVISAAVPKEMRA